ncbi:MAG: hypothetical protein IKB62_05920 [Oscillospiraceae bacterium]|nr:hypothetical protein [Oscillospiraceae bacterium]
MSFSPVSAASNAAYKLAKPLLEKLNTHTLSPADLFMRQMYKGEFCHYDIVVKYMVLQHEFSGRYPDIWSTYRKMQLFGNSEEFADMRIRNFRKAVASLKKDGFLHNDTISLDKEFYIRDGSHRTAMALFCDIDKVYALVKDIPYLTKIKIADFKNTDFTPEEREEIQTAYLEMCRKANKPLQIAVQGNKEDIDTFAKSVSVYGRTAISQTDSRLVQAIMTKSGCKAVGGKAGAKGVCAIISLQLDSVSYKKLGDYTIPFISYGKDREVIFSCYDNMVSLALQDTVSAVIPRNFLENTAITDIISKGI